VPPKGYRHVSLKEEVYARLVEFMDRKGLTSVNDAIVTLLEYEGIYSKLEYILQKGVSTLPQNGVRLPQTGVSQKEKSTLANTLLEKWLKQ